MTREEQWLQFQQRLDEHHDWPCAYVFKFIAPAARADEVQRALGDGEVRRRPSSSGKYLSLTLEREMPSSAAVITIYRRVATIEGVISL